MIRSLQSLLTIALMLYCASHASGSLLYYDSIDYAAGAGSNLSTAAPSNWSHSGTAVEPIVQNNANLTFPNLLISNDTFGAQYDGSGGAGIAAHEFDAIGINSGTLYWSMLMKVPTVNTGTGTAGNQGFSTGANLVNGSFMAGFDTIAPTTAPGTNNSAATLLIRSGDGTQNAVTYQLGTSVTTNTAARTWYTVSNGPPTNFSTGANAETVFVVLKYTFDATAANETSKLFINPTPGNTEPATAQITATYDTNFVRNNGFRSFFLRNNAVEPDVLFVDEIRIGTTWEDVTPAIPEPATAVLAVFGLCVSLLGRRRPS